MRYTAVNKKLRSNLLNHSFSAGFANLLQSMFPNYQMKILRYISERFIYTRITYINFLKKEEKRLKKLAKDGHSKIDETSLRSDTKVLQYVGN